MSKRQALTQANLVKVNSGTFQEDVTFVWKIDNFLAVISSSELILKQQFSYEAGIRHKFPTKWNCAMEVNQEKHSVGIHISLLSSPQNCQVVASCKFKCIKPAGDITQLESSDPKLFTRSMSWRCAKIVPVGMAAINELIWKDGSISIQMNFTLYIKKPVVIEKTLDLEEEKNSFEKKELHNLSMSLLQTLEHGGRINSSELVHMVSRDQVRFCVNKYILSARSPVFRAMFESGNWRETKDSNDGVGIVVLEDLSGKTINVLLHYIYGGILKDDWKDENVVLELVWAARKYQLDDLCTFLDKVIPGIPIVNTEILSKLALLAKRLDMKNAEQLLFNKLKEVVVDIDELISDKHDSLLCLN